MEVSTGAENANQNISASDVLKSVNDFGQQFQAGFSDRQEELAAYGNVLVTLDSYFSQGEVEKLPEARDLVRELVHHHAESAHLPLGFLIDVRDKIKKEVLEGGWIPQGTRRFADEVTVLQDAIRSELQETALNYNREAEARAKIERLAAKAKGADIQTPIELEIAPKELRARQVQEQAIQVLSNEGEFREDCQKRARIITELSQLATKDSFDPEILRQTFSEFSEFFNDPSLTTSFADEVHLRASLGQNSRVKELIASAAVQAEDPIFLWKHWVQEGKLPRPLFDAFDEIVTLSEFFQVVQAVSAAPREIKAYYLAPFIKRGITSGLIGEIVNGKYEISDDLIIKQIDAFVHFFDNYQKAQKSSGKFKRVLIAATAVAAISMASHFCYQQVVEDKPRTEVADQTDPDEAIENLIKQIEQQTTDVPGRERLSKESPYNVLGASESTRPENNSPEDILEGRKNTIWTISGSDLSGYYRESTSTVFDTQKRDWLFNRQYSQNSQKLLGKIKEISVSGTFKIGSRVVPLPTKPNLAISGWSRIPDLTFQPGVLQSPDGTYFLYFAEEDVGKTVYFQYSLGKVDGSSVPKPDSFDLDKMSRKIIDVDSLPKDVRDFLEGLNARSDLSKETKAKILEKYIRNNFTYSLVPAWSDYYHGGDGEFFKRIFEVRKVDCDVANTALIAILREVGVPSRMAYGFANGSFLDGRDDRLTAAERHGYVEVYVDGKWITLDGTPEKMDEYTEKALSGLTSASELESLRQKEELDKEQLSREIFSLKDLVADNTAESALVAIFLLNCASWAASRSLRRRNNQELRRLIAEIKKRAGSYVNNDQELTQYFASWENRRLYPNYQNEMQGVPSLVPPFALVGLIRDIAKAWSIHSLPYQERHIAETSGSSEPNLAEFRTEVLGYHPEMVKRGIQTRAYLEMAKKLRSKVKADGAELFITRGAKKEIAFYWYTVAKVFDVPYRISVARAANKLGGLYRLWIPKNQDEFDTLQKELLENLYGRYSSMRTKAERNRKKQEITEDLPARLTRQEFGGYLDGLLRNHMVLWQIEQVAKGTIRSKVN